MDSLKNSSPEKFVNNVVNTFKNSCNPLQLFTLLSVILIVFEVFDAKNFNISVVFIQFLVVIISGGLIYKLCKDKDVNMAYLTLGIFLSFWFIQKSKILDSLFDDSNSNKNVNVNTNANMNANSNANKNVSVLVEDKKPSNIISEPYMKNKIEKFGVIDDIKSMYSNSNNSNNSNESLMINIEKNNVIPVPSNSNTLSENAGSMNNKKSEVVNSNVISVEGNSSNSVGAFAKSNSNYGNLAKYYEKRAEWIPQIDSSRPVGDVYGENSNAPCVIQQHDARSALELPENKLRNYGINSRTTEPYYELKSEDRNKVQTGYDNMDLRYTSVDSFSQLA